MWSLQCAGCLALLCQLLGTWGNLLQIRLNAERRSTDGLSFFDWEARVWSKLPWLAFIFSVQKFDSALLASILLSLVPPFIVLSQFIRYSPAAAVYRPRVRIQYLLLVTALLLALTARTTISELGFVLAVLPVVCTLISVAGGGSSQFRHNQLRGDCSAVAGERYFLLIASNLLWLLYGVTKGCTSGWEGAWTVAASSSIGLVVYVVLATQFIALSPGVGSRGGVLRLLRPA